MFRLLFQEVYLLELNGGNQQYNFKNLVELLSLNFNRHCVFYGVESWIEVLDWSHGVEYWSGFLEWNIGVKF